MLDRISVYGPRQHTVLLVEHDAETILRADYAIDLAPGVGRLRIPVRQTRRAGDGRKLVINGARELSRRQTGRTLYILDEPTTGLHFDDIKKLLAVLQRLVDLGNTVVVIEHQLDVVKSADWVIDLGPEGGDRGGHIVAAGTPEQLARHKKSYTGQALAKLLP